MFDSIKFLSDLKIRLQKIIESSKDDIFLIRTGKASPGILEKLIVTCYQGTTRLKLLELATISVEGPQLLLVTPFDTSTIKDIEKSILTSPLNLTPRTEGAKIHISIPALSEEQRIKFLKLVATKIEEGRSKARVVRDDARRIVRQHFSNKEISEDEKFRLEKEIDKLTQEFNTEVEDMKKKKEKEIMEV